MRRAGREGLDMHIIGPTLSLPALVLLGQSDAPSDWYSGPAQSFVEI